MHYSGCRRLVLEGAILLIVQQQDSAGTTDCKISKSVIVVITRSAADAMTSCIDPGLLRYIRKLAVPHVVIEGHPPLRAMIGKKDVDAAIAVVIEKTGA